MAAAFLPMSSAFFLALSCNPPIAKVMSAIAVFTLSAVAFNCTQPGVTTLSTFLLLSQRTNALLSAMK
jgi:hypothetical protein